MKNGKKFFMNIFILDDPLVKQAYWLILNPSSHLIKCRDKDNIILAHKDIKQQGGLGFDQTLSSGEAGCQSGGPLSVRRPIANGEALITPTPLLFK